MTVKFTNKPPKKPVGRPPKTKTQGTISAIKKQKREIKKAQFFRDRREEERLFAEKEDGKHIPIDVDKAIDNGTLCAQEIFAVYESVYGEKPGPQTRKYIVANLFARDIVNRKAPSVSQYSSEVFDLMMERLCDGESLNHICHDPFMPSISRFIEWITERPELAAKYTVAKEISGEVIAERAIREALNFRNELQQINKGDGTVDIIIKDNVARSRLATDTLKWQAARVAPRTYGAQHTSHSVDSGGSGPSAGDGLVPGQVVYKVINSPDIEEGENLMEERIAANVVPDEHYGENIPTDIKEGDEDA